MKFGIHYGYWLHTWENADLKYYCRKAANLGFDLLELSGHAILSASEAELRELRELADGLGVGVNACHGLSRENSTSSADSAARARGIDELKRLYDRVELIGSRQLGGTLYSYWPSLDASNEKLDLRGEWDRSLESVAVAADEAAGRGITLMLEVVNRFEGYLFNTAKDALRYLDELGRSNVKLLHDVFHMNIEEDSLSDAIRLAGGRLGHLHIGECNRRVPGRGHMPWDDIAQGLRDIGYDAGVVMEPFVLSGGEVADSVKVWRDLNSPDEDVMDSELRFALDFVKKKFL